MSKRLLLVAASLAALSACGSGNGTANNVQTTNTVSTSGSTSTGGSTTVSSTSTSTGGGDATLQQEIAQQVAAAQSHLPIRQGGVTITAIEGNANEIITTMEVPIDLNEQSFGVMRSRLPAQACSNPQVRPVIARGGVLTYKVKDSGGEEFTMSVNSCPGAGGAAGAGTQ
jgi:hypothetical protein